MKQPEKDIALNVNFVSGNVIFTDMIDLNFSRVLGIVHALVESLYSRYYNLE